MQGRRLVAGMLALGTLLLGTACAGDSLSGTGATGGDGGSSGGKGPVLISGQSFTEAEIVAQMYKLLLAEAGYQPELKLVDTRAVYMQRFPEKIDVVPEYVGGILNYLNTARNGPDAEPLTSPDASEMIQNAQQLLDQAGIVLLEPSRAADSNAYFVTEEYAQQHDLQTLSDMKGMEVVLAAAPDCEERRVCAPGLEKVYGITITKVLPLGFASTQTYQAVLEGEAQLGQTSTTDGTLESQGLVVLEDDKGLQPAGNLVPAVAEDFLTKHPGVKQILGDLMATLTTEKLTELNRQVSVERKKPVDVARQFLVEEGLIEG